MRMIAFVLALLPLFGLQAAAQQAELDTVVAKIGEVTTALKAAVTELANIRGSVCLPAAMVNIRAAVSNVPTGSIPTSFGFTYPYGPGSTTWNFPVTVDTGKVLLVTDIFFQDKAIHYWGVGYRPNYAILNSIDTLTSVIPSRHYRTPIRLPAGFVLEGSFINHSPEVQNMIVGLNGCYVSVE